MALVSSSGSEGEFDVWVFHLERETRTRLTFTPESEVSPVWSADGQYVYFSRAGPAEGEKTRILRKRADGAGEEELIAELTQAVQLSSISRDGQYLFMTVTSPETGRDIWVLGLEEGEAQPLIAGTGHDMQARLSPDGKWLAYVSIREGRSERQVFLQSFPSLSGRWQVSESVGNLPFWSSDGKRIFFDDGSEIHEVPLTFSEGAVEVGKQSPASLAIQGAQGIAWAPSGDGQRFLLYVAPEGARPREDIGDTTVVRLTFNWLETLRQRLDR